MPSLPLLRRLRVRLRRPARTATRPAACPSVRRRRSRAALAWAPVAFTALLAAGWAAAETFTPEITDTDYHHRIRLVRARAAEHPHNPLGVVIGSSRVMWGFRPESLPEPPPGAVYWVNAGHIGGGPTLNRLTLHRLLRDGVRPAVLVVEVMPSFFAHENAPFVARHLTAAELPVVRGYGASPLEFDYQVLRHRIGRLPDLGRVFDPFDGYEEPLPRGGLPTYDEDGGPEDRERRLAVQARHHRAPMRRMTVRTGADRAFRDTLTEAARHGMRVVLLRTPEGPTHKSWYDPAGVARFDAYLDRVACEFGLPVIDARDWLDEDDFYDSHHARRSGAEKFTARFAGEVSAVLGR